MPRPPPPRSAGQAAEGKTRVKPGSPALGAHSLNHRTTGEVSKFNSLQVLMSWKQEEQKPGKAPCLCGPRGRRKMPEGQPWKCTQPWTRPVAGRGAHRLRPVLTAPNLRLWVEALPSPEPRGFCKVGVKLELRNASLGKDLQNLAGFWAARGPGCLAGLGLRLGGVGKKEKSRKFETSHVGGATGRTPPIPRSALETRGMTGSSGSLSCGAREVRAS